MLRGLYEQYGYGLYRMAKFEEYDFYTEHKDFLPSSQILAFTDIGGKLMALKPDVTMSIVKRTRATMDRPERLYYNESIYRPSRDAREFKEIRQVGLEYIGRVTPYADAELVTLALKSLASMDGEYVLDVSHMGFLTGLLDSFEAPRQAKLDMLRCIEAKNAHGLARLAEAHGVGGAHAGRLMALVSMSGGVEAALERARGIVANGAMQAALDELEALFGVFPPGSPLREALRLEFSITLDSKYYNGLMFRGYIKSAPRAILSGGRYDPLLRRLGVHELEAIGFAVYLDEAERSMRQRQHRGCDAVVLYDAASPPASVHGAVERLVAEGGRVCVATAMPEGMRGDAMVYRLRGGVLSAPVTASELAAASGAGPSCDAGPDCGANPNCGASPNCDAGPDCGAGPNCGAGPDSPFGSGPENC
jgi:ATP phosphoribosyltransferase regulatory subunit